MQQYSSISTGNVNRNQSNWNMLNALWVEQTCVANRADSDAICVAATSKPTASIQVLCTNWSQDRRSLKAP
jgi:hypothetical protein